MVARALAAFGGLAALGALAVLFSWAAGCEALVDGKLNDVHCVAEGVVGSPACPVGDVCEQGVCTPLELGLPCATDSDCWPGDLCFDPALFGATGPKTCSRPCCTSDDCDPDPGFVCWIPAAGGGPFCRSAVDLGRGQVKLGASPAWEACATDADCRSGLCDPRARRCADTCCSDTSCAGIVGACQFASAPSEGDAAGFLCATPLAGAGARYASCTKDSDCTSGLCVLSAEQGRCSSPCCSSSMCETVPGSAQPVRCMTVLHDGIAVRACGDELPSTATAPVGAACTENEECRSGDCLSGVCSDDCCLDASCGDTATFGCLPTESSASWALQCVPN